MRLAELVETSRAVAATTSRKAKIDLLAGLMQQLDGAEIEIAVSFLSGAPRQDRIGVGPATVHGTMPAQGAERATLSLTDVDQELAAIAAAGGKGSAGERARRVTALFARATRPEQEFLAGLLLGEVRQGALEAIMLEAIARAASVPAHLVRRAAMTAGDPAAVASAALTGGQAALSAYAIQLFRPVLPMLAATAQDTDQALAAIGRAAFEYKLDGARMQVHKQGTEVRVYTRNLNDVTEAVPEVVEAVRALPAGELILDGEAIALRQDGRPQPFQVTMQRFGRRLDVEEARPLIPLRAFFFDLLWLDGTPLMDEPLEERLLALQNALPAAMLIPRLVTDQPDEARAFFSDALARGQEGVMAKALGAPYEAGRRGSNWLKIKYAHTLDLVILAAEWGHGRRRGWLSNLHLGARDSAGDGFVMLGKTFKGLTDEMLRWQTRRLLELETAREGHVVHVRPELVAEIVFNDVQSSPHYPGGLALRFARVKGYRQDKGPADADTFATVQEIYRRATGQEPPA